MTADVTTADGLSGDLAPVVDGVSLAVQRGTLTAILGPSGSGKTRLLSIIGGLETPTRGHVRFGETDIASLTDDERSLFRRANIGWVFRNPRLFPGMTVMDNILLPLTLGSRRWGRRAQQVLHDEGWCSELILLLGLQERLSQKPENLAPEVQQRVAIARALVSKPALILADEPTGNFTSAMTRYFLDLFRRCVREYGQTVLLITHDNVVASYADRVLLMRDGSLVGDTSEPSTEAGLSAFCGLASRSRQT